MGVEALIAVVVSLSLIACQRPRSAVGASSPSDAGSPGADAGSRTDGGTLTCPADGGVLDVAGFTWQNVTPSTLPAARYEAAMAYDSVHGASILYGGTGSASGTVLGDTWTWNGSSWSRSAPATSPRPCPSRPWPSTQRGA